MSLRDEVVTTIADRCLDTVYNCNEPQNGGSYNSFRSGIVSTPNCNELKRRADAIKTSRKDCLNDKENPDELKRYHPDVLL